MRAYRFSYDESFKTGLVSENPTSVGLNGFSRLVNLKPYAGGLQFRPQPIVTVITDSATEIIKFGPKLLALDSHSVYEVNQPNGALVEKSSLSVGSVHDTSVRWQFADFIHFGILQHNSGYFYQAYIDKNGVVTFSSPSGTDVPHAVSMIDLNGQLILGGILDSWNSLDDTYVAWSKIGSISFDVDKTNEAGFFNPNIGKVLSVLRLDQSFVALGSDGIALFYPADQTFGYKKIADYGILSQWHCCSSGSEVYFKDKNSVLRRIKAETAQNVETLGYSWLLTGHDCKLHWGRAEEELRILLDNSSTLCLDEFGMSQIDIAIVGEGVISGGHWHFAYGNSVLGDAIFELSPKNAEVSGLKSISEVHILNALGVPQYSYVVAMKGKQEFSSKDYLLSDMGLTTPNVTADIYRIGHRVPAYQAALALDPSASITALSVQTVKVDGRFGRGYQPGLMPTGG